MYQIASANTKGDIHLKQPWHQTDFDEWKVNLESDPETVDDIKDLDWEETHRQWNEDFETWVLDLDALWTIIDHLSDRGYDITIEKDVFNCYRKEIANEQDL